ncbi:MAG: glycosyltransferase [Chloroflexota bacterium]|nr:glycosyltransferase [Chloroflexota bacterium]
MAYHIVIASGLVVFILSLVLNLRALKRPSANAAIAEPAPLVSVLIPARDEEADIEKCPQSLREQDYPSYEILVLDDGSSHGTAGIVSRMAADDSRIRLVRGEPLPEGWAGKPYACHQLATMARGSWLLFVDADTVHGPGMLRGVLSLALHLKASLLSGFPRQLKSTLPQKVAIPTIYFIVMGWMPIWWLQRCRMPKPSLAIGQFLLFPTDEYWRIGGHEGIRSKLLEDVWLGIETCRHGGRHVAIDLSAVVSCNMYRSVWAMWEGLVRSLYAVAILTPAGLVGMIAAGYVFFLVPFYSLWNVLVVGTGDLVVRGIVLFQVGAILLMRWLVDRRFKEPVISTVLHPFGFSFLFVATLYAAALRIVGGRVRWKRRVYGVGGCADESQAVEWK